MPIFKYTNLIKSDVDVDGRAELRFSIIEDGALLADNALITCAPDEFETKFTEKCNGIVDQRTVLDALPVEGSITL